jgi:hypothetical protein
VVTVGTFVGRIQVLRDNVGSGKLTGHLEVNQRYAADQHWHDEYIHPDGGKAFYLRDPLFAQEVENMERLARGVLEEEGKGLADAMMDCMEHLSRGVEIEAPLEFFDLARSGHPSVTHNGEIIKDRAPHRHRLTDEELKIKGRLSHLYDPHRRAVR